jgi:hypothetical protein
VTETTLSITNLASTGNIYLAYQTTSGVEGNAGFPYLTRSLP